ncbi:MAG: lipid-binding SYLF domain-containing protein [Sulfurimonas sp.]|jgi:lipid-binding SYLF domain-containing protein|uniref:hypothetical protein n=1 Tax=Sulfurimonas sp. TaxID=2022749 RepID=UPI0039E4C4AD
MKNFKLLTVLILLALLFSGFSFGNFGDNDNERRSDRIAEGKSALRLLFKTEPQAKKEVADAYGFATFKNYGMSMMMMSADGGRGLAYDRKNDKITYMNMASGGMGMGLGAKEYFSVFIFKNAKVYNDFIEEGWEANTEIDASLKTKDDGEATNESHTVRKGIKLYKVTKNGAIMQVSLHGTKYWKCKDLN